MKIHLPLGLRSSMALLFTAIALSPAARAATFIWKGGAGANDWTLAGNWTTTTPPNDGTASLLFTDSFFSGTAFIFPNLNVNYSVNSLSFSGAASFSLGTSFARELTIGSGGLTQSSVAAQGIALPVFLGAAQTWTLPVGAGALSVSSVITSGQTLSVNALGTNALTTTISGTGGLTKIGAGALTLNGANTFTGLTNVNAGTLTLPAGGSLVNSSVQVAPGATLTINGGGIDAGTAFYFAVGNANSATAATANLMAGTLSTTETDIASVAGSVASFAQTGGTHVASSALLLGLAAGSSGTYTLSGASSVLTTPTTAVGLVGLGLFTQSGGTHTVSNAGFVVGNGVGSSGTYQLQGGQLFTGVANFGVRGNGTMVQTGGTHTAGGVAFGAFASGVGQYQLSGGTLQTGSVARGPGSGTFLFNSGLLQATRENAFFMAGLTSAKVQAGGAKIATGNFNVTIAQPLLHDETLGATPDGGLVKTGTGTLTLSGASTFTGNTVVSAGTLNLGASGSLTGSSVEIAPGAAVTINGGSVTSGGSFAVGNAAGATAATASLVAGSLSTGETDIGNAASGTATFTQTGGTHTATSLVKLGAVAGSTGIYEFSGAASQLVAPSVYVGWNGPGTFTQSGGTLSITNTVMLAGSAAAAGNFYLQDGQLSTGYVILGVSGTGVFNQTGGTLTTRADGGIYLGYNPGSSGTYELNAGTLQAGFVNFSAGTGTLNFNGGTLQPRQNLTTFLTGLTAANVKSGGAKIDTAGFNITIAQPLLHDAALGLTPDGGLVKTGAGTLTLTGANTFTGSTTVSAGTLTIGPGGSLTNGLVQVNAGGTFTINGGSVNVGAAAYFQVGNDVGTASASLLAGTLTSTETDLGNGTGSIGNFTHSGGTHTVAGGLYLAVGSGSGASYTLGGVGSQVSAATTNVGWRGAGTFTQTGGTLTTNRVQLGNFSTGTGTYRLSGGTLKTHRIARGSGAGTFFFDGGTAQLTASDSNFVSGLTVAYIGAGGAKIDTNGFDAIIKQGLMHDPALSSAADGGVTKSGAGKLTFTTSQTLSSLTISGGTVRLGSAAPAPAFEEGMVSESFAQAVPEPGAGALLAGAAVLLGFTRRRSFFKAVTLATHGDDVLR